MNLTDKHKKELFRQGVIERIESGMFTVDKTLFLCEDITCSDCGLFKDRLCPDTFGLVEASNMRALFKIIGIESYLKEHPEYLI